MVPFADESGFREGVWNVEYELANMLSIELEAIPEWRVVPFLAVAELTLEYGAETETKALQIARQLGADVVLLGLLQDYDMRRFSVGDPLLGGYKSYTAVAQMQVRDAEQPLGPPPEWPHISGKPFNTRNDFVST